MTVLMYPRLGASREEKKHGASSPTLLGRGERRQRYFRFHPGGGGRFRGWCLKHCFMKDVVCWPCQDLTV